MVLRRDPAWSLNQEAFERLLAGLSPDRDQAAAEYERLRRKLFSFFDWRGSTCPDALADEALDRVARRLQEGEPVEDVGRYVYGVARRVLFEWQRQRLREQAVSHEAHAAAPDGDLELQRERRLACLERCLEELGAEDRSLILDYHLLPEGSPPAARALLAQRLGVPYGTLKTRAHRARGRLEACLRACLGAPPGTSRGPVSHPDEGTRASMGRESERDQEMTGYLLGTASPEAQAAVEERYFTDDGYYEELLAAADELILAYLAGDLSSPDQERFESHFLASPWRRQRLDFMRDMLAAARKAGAARVEGPARSRSWVRWAIAAALLLAASALVAALVRTSRRETPRIATTTPPSAVPSPTPVVPGPSPAASAAAAQSALVRVPRHLTGPVEVALAASARSLQVEIEVEGGHLSYDAAVTRGGRKVWSAQELARSHPAGTVLVTIPAEVLTGGDHLFSVEGEALRGRSPPPPRVVTLRIVRSR